MLPTDSAPARVVPYRTNDERLWATLAHLCGLLWLSGVPFSGTIASGVVYVTKRHLSPYVAVEAREAQNFQNTVALAVLGVVAISAVTFGSDMVATLQTGRTELDNGQAQTALWTILLMTLALAAIMAANVALSIVAAVATYRGRTFRYPVCARWLRVQIPR